ncbi:PucR family transcriptional regulator [Microbacterium pseudoresistens]|uniref:Purine catabolism regulator n=1 Tax=Microbacterium pseudoresistens TaxID=640634 RepID=A0A7Y9ET47_9MICO|nr:PucR family transcriptional regulator [Microbacterium pseudoresistens]NYD53459.1 purine catabolism regulator [Microbacterium pseudoresistens]
MTEPTLRGLLATSDLGLRLVSDDADDLDRPLRWVHSTDLADPTPFLADDLVLLTTGSQFDGALSATEYVGRLAARGVVALGFGSGVHRTDIPADLIDACATAGLTLFEVPYRTPFIAVARAHAEAIAAQAYARRSWALETQRALAVAALRRHGLSSIVRELGHRLDAWVAMFDASGEPVLEHPPAGLPDSVRAALAQHVGEVLARGTETGRAVDLDGTAVQLFTLGRSRGLRGVIAIAAPPLDAEARAVVTSVIAMAGLALEQTDRIAADRRLLHTQVLASLRTDDPALAEAVLGVLPAPPILVGVALDARIEALEEWWERRRTERGSRALLAETDEGIAICAPDADAGLFDEAAAHFGIRIGVSDPADYSGFSEAFAQALGALRHDDSGDSGALHFSDVAGAGIRSALGTEDARLIAAARLAPLDADPGDLVRTLRVWLEHDARFESAATALGIHRHTLRTRIGQASRLLRMDLSSFPARAELWAMLTAAG